MDLRAAPSRISAIPRGRRARWLQNRPGPSARPRGRSFPFSYCKPTGFAGHREAWCRQNELRSSGIFRAVIGTMRLHIRGRAAGAIVLLFAQPNLAASKQRHADKTAHFEFLAAFGELHLDAVNLAGFGIEYLAALILFALLHKTRKDRHAEHRLVVPSAIALVAFGRGVVSWLRKNFLDCEPTPSLDRSCRRWFSKDRRETVRRPRGEKS